MRLNSVEDMQGAQHAGYESLSLVHHDRQDLGQSHHEADCGPSLRARFTLELSAWQTYDAASCSPAQSASTA